MFVSAMTLFEVELGALTLTIHYKLTKGLRSGGEEVFYFWSILGHHSTLLPSAFTLDSPGSSECSYENISLFCVTGIAALTFSSKFDVLYFSRLKLHLRQE